MAVSTAPSPTRPLYWSVRRELWENRSIYIGPLIAGGVYLIGFLISLRGFPRSMRALPTLAPAQQLIFLATPYSHAAMLLSLAAFLVGVFYSLDALHGERRERSILFWKSLPVSDRTTVISKASIPLAVLPLLAFAVTVIVQILMRLLATAVLLLSGVSASPLWTQLPLFQMELVMLYSVVVIALWHAPIYCWLLLVSGWARRATFLWAVLPPLAIAVIERVAFSTTHFVSAVLKDRFLGFTTAAFDLKDKAGVPINPHFIPLAQLAPERFLGSAGLWTGLIVAVALLAAAVRLRRYREPI